MARVGGIVTWGDDPRRADQLARMLAMMPGAAPRTVAGAAASLGTTGAGGGVVAADGWLLALDGRLLNRAELGDGQGDAAILLDCVRKHGFADAMAQADGDLAVACFDPMAGMLWLGRDRFGVKPLYYAVGREGAGVASMPAPLTALTGVGADIDRQYAALVAGSHYRTFDNGPARSPFARVAQLPAAHVVAIGPDGAHDPQPYWRLERRTLDTLDEAALAERYRELLLAAVKRRLAVAETPAFTLSGGMDSSSVLTSATLLNGRPSQAYSSVYVDPTFDERAEIADVIDAGLAEWHPVELDDEIDALATVRRLVAVHNEPVATATWLAHDAVARAVAADGYGSLFGGLGGDELNAGEYEYFPLFFADLRAAGEDERLAHEIERWAHYHDHPIHKKNAKVAAEMMATLTVPGSVGHCRPNLERQQRYFPAVRADFFDLTGFTPVMEHPFDEFLANRAYQDLTRETTPCCLRAEDRQCAAFGLEHFDPFLDRALVEFMFAVPSTMKIRDGVTKRLLRQAMAGILPEGTRGRIKKTGWNAPAHKWFTGPGLDALRDVVNSQKFRARGIYDVAEVTRLLDEHEAIVRGNEARENHMMFLWQLINLEAWLDWVDAGLPPATVS